MQNIKKHNGIISFWKFIFSIVIAFFHTNQFYADNVSPIFRLGYIAVEFYFIITGFYFAKKVLKESYNKKNIGIETVKFTISKIKTFFLPLLIIYVIQLIGIIVYEQYTVSQIVDTIWSFLLCRNLGIGSVRILGQLWYLSVMIIGLMILYPFVKKYKENFIYLICPIFVVLGLSFIYHNYGTIDVANRYWFYAFNPSIIRGLVDISIGMLLFLIHENLKNVKYTTTFKIFLTALGETLFISVLLVIQFISSAKRYEFVMLIIIAIGVLIISSEKTYDFKIFSNKFSYYLEKISLYVFINHTTVYFYMGIFCKALSPVCISIFSVIITVLFSILEERILSFIKTKEWNKKILEKWIISSEGK